MLKMTVSRDWYYTYLQKQPSRCVLRKRWFENMQQIYRRTPMLKCDFNKILKQLEIRLRHGCSPVSLLHIFRTPFSKNTCGGLLLYWETKADLNVCGNPYRKNNLIKGHCENCTNCTLIFQILTRNCLATKTPFVT